ERLVYRKPAHEVKVSVKADQSTYTPGGKVKLDISTTDEAGKAISAIVGLTVTDDAVLEMIEKREQAPRLPVMVMLEPEVKELADAQIYLDPTNAKAPLATDLLLGTQGWRRFALVEREKFVAAHGDDARRVLAMRVVTAVEQQQANGIFMFADGLAAPGQAGAMAGGGAGVPARMGGAVKAAAARPEPA